MSKIIAVYGSPGSGKSMFSAALGAQLAKAKKHVVVLSTNKVVPMLKVLAPMELIQKQHSIGGLFLSSSLSQEAVCKRIVFHPKQDNLGFMGFATGDTPNAYTGIFTAEKLQMFYNILLALVDYLIVDCTSNLTPSSDPLASTGLVNAAVAIKMLTPDIVGVEYNKATYPMFRETLSPKHHICVLGRCTPNSPIKEIMDVLEEPIFSRIPFSEEAAEFFQTGRLLTGLKTREGTAFQMEIKKTVQEVLK